MIFAGIVAGGKGTRMSDADKPKQFLDLGGEPILIRTVKAFLEMSEIELVYIGINHEWYVYTAELLCEHIDDTSRVKLINGGKDRSGTVMNIVSALTGEFGINKGDILLTHDAVRPFVSRTVIEKNIECAREHSACGTYIPSEDTIIRSQDNTTVSHNLVRSELYRAQTPQTFEVSALCSCIDKLGEEKASALTDTCGIFTECGMPIYIVQGEPQNFKITTQYDLKTARSLLAAGEIR